MQRSLHSVAPIPCWKPKIFKTRHSAVDVVYIANLSNESADCFPVIVERAKKYGALVAANPGPRQLSARGEAFFESLAAIDILVLNQIEADLLVPRLIAHWGEGGPVLTFSPGEADTGTGRSRIGRRPVLR